MLVTSASLLAGSLPQELLDEGRFSEARMESLRSLSANPEDYSSLLVSLKAGIRLGLDKIDGLKDLAANEKASQELRCEAHFELASIFSSRNEPGQALDHYVACFNKTSSSELFASATRKANGLLNDNPELEASHMELVSIIRTSAASWPRRQASGRKSASPPILSLPALWAITFYKTQINPAIGTRCSLVPSCSQYAVKALRAHGFIGLAITGDRMVREPDVVAAKEKPLIINGQIKYADQLEDHTSWIKEKD